MGIKKNYSIEEKQALAIALDDLKRLNSWLIAYSKESILSDSEELEAYLLRPYKGETANTDKDKEFEKTLYVSVLKSQSKYIPLSVKEARANASIEGLRYARIMALHESGKLTSKEYERLKNENYICTTLSRFRKTKRWAIRKGIKYTLSGILAIVGAPYAGAAFFAGFFIWDIIPKSRKEKIKEKTKEVIHGVERSLSNALEKLVLKGEKLAYEVCEKINIAYKNAKEVAIEVKETVVNITKNTYEKAKEIAKKTGKVIEKFFNYA